MLASPPFLTVLTGTQHALVDDQPGVTRDRREGEGSIGPLHFRLFDTAGLDEAEDGSLQARMTEQTLLALNEADITLFVIDGRAGLTPMDKHFAQTLRKVAKKVVLVVNKAEGNAANSTVHESYALGFGEPVAISAAHGEGMGELYDAFASHPGAELPALEGESFEPPVAEDETEELHDPIIRIAIVGRPNAGKSTLINRLLKADRLLTGPEAGITRDAIAVPFEYDGRSLKLVDTAGMRRRTHIEDAVEKMAVGDTLHAIQYAHVVVLVVDAAQPLEKQELAIAGLVEREGRALVLAINKWDQIKDQASVKKLVEDRLQTAMPHIKGIPVVYLSGLKGTGLPMLMREVFRIYELWNMRISTGELNRWLDDALNRHSPPLISGRRLKIRYVTQAKARPPTLVFSANLAEKDIPDHYMRYLLNDLRGWFKLPGVPVRFKVRKGKNPYA